MVAYKVGKCSAEKQTPLPREIPEILIYEYNWDPLSIFSLPVLIDTSPFQEEIQGGS